MCSFFSREKFTRAALTLVAVPLLFAFLGFFHPSLTLSAADEESAVTAEAVELTGADVLTFARELIKEADGARAEKVLEQYLEDFFYNDDYLDVLADLKELEDDEDYADALKDQLKDKGYDRKKAETAVHPDACEDAAELCADFDELLYGERALGEVSSYDIDDLADEMRELRETAPELFQIRELAKCERAILILKGDTEELFADANDFSDTELLLDLAELWRQGKIGKHDLEKNEAISEQADLAETVLDWVEREEKKSGYSDRDYEILDAAEEELQELSDSDTGSFELWLRRELTEAAEDEEERESSKLYLELSRLDYDKGDEDGAASYLQKAMTTASDSADASYKGPAAELNRVVEEKDDTEGRKETGVYAEELVDNMRTETMKAATDAGIPAAVNDEGYIEFTAAEAEQSFSGFVSDQINRVTESINIASLDKSKFETISAIVALDESYADTAEKFKENMAVYDCDTVIRDYRVEKLEDAGVNVILCCDNSGSMDGQKILDLKSALTAFTASLDADVEVGIVSFSSGVNASGSASLGSSESTLRGAIDQMDAGGGTDIWAGVRASLDELSRGDELNIVIVMSDGQDSAPSTDRLTELRAECEDRNTVIYTMGLGADVDSGVLSLYSNYGGGSYDYVSNSETMVSFYHYIYNLSRNRYRVTYEAVDTITVSRKLDVYYAADTRFYGEKAYSLHDNSDVFSEDDLGEEYKVTLDGAELYGLDTRLLYKSRVDQTVRLRGSGLTKEKEIAVSIKDACGYDLPCEYESDESWRVTISPKVTCGVYDVTVTVNGKRAVFDAGLVITDDDLSLVRFGPYVFSATGVEKTRESTRLTGYIRMNDWLGFSGSVTLRGDVDHDDSVALVTRQSYVTYRAGDSDLNLLASLMAKTGKPVSLPGFGSLTLYRNESVSPDSDDFRVEKAVTLGGLTIKDIFTISAPGVTLYPDRAEIGFEDFTTEFPFQDKLLEAGELDKIFEYSAEHEEKLILSGDAIDCSFELKVGSTDDKLFHEGKLGNLKLLLNLNAFELKIDTNENEYSFKILVNIAMLSDGLGVKLEWKDGGLDTIMLYADFDINTSISGVPVTFSDFKLGAEDLPKQYNLQGILSSLIVGGCEISVAKISEVIPKLADYIDDAAVFALEDVELKFRLLDPYVSLGAKAKLLGFLDVGEAKIQMGMGIPYSNSLLGFGGEKMNGFLAELKIGLAAEAGNFKFDVNGQGSLALLSQVFGSYSRGTAEVNVEWWVLRKHARADGDFFIGVYQTHSGGWKFAVKARDNFNREPFSIEADIRA